MPRFWRAFASVFASFVCIFLAPRAAGADPYGFATAAIIGIPPRCTDLKIADIDGDGHPDVFMAHGSAQALVVLHNDGAGHLAPTSYPIGWGNAVSPLDYDGDGMTDAVCTNWFEGTMTVYWNQGGGVLGSSQSWRMGTNSRDLVGADFNGDGITDVAVAAQDTVWVRRGLGGRQFASPIAIFVGGALKAIDAGDFNRDGRVDLVAIDVQNSRMILLYNLGSTAFSVAPMGAVGTHPSDVVVTDLDQDGWVDIAIAAEDKFAYVYRNQQGSFPARTAFPIGELSQSIAAGDVDSDGLTDLVCTGYKNSIVTVAHNLGAMNFGNPLITSIGQGPRCAAPADIDGDGRVDVVSGSEIAATAHVLRNIPLVPLFVLETPQLDFGAAPQGVTRDLAVSFRNEGVATLTVTPGAIDHPEFTLVGPASPVNVAPGASRTFTLRYSRATIGQADGTFHLATNDTLAPSPSIALTGVATPPPLVQASAPPTFELAVGQQLTGYIVIRNLGDGPLHLTVPDAVLDLAETCPQDLGLTSGPFMRFDAGGGSWNVRSNGSVEGGVQGEYRNGMLLAGFASQAAGTLGLGGRELRLGPVLLPNGIRVTRKVYVPEGEAFVRYVDVAENTDSVAHPYTFDCRDTLGYAAIVPIRTSSGDATFAVNDDWIVLPADDMPGRRSIGRVFRTEVSPLHPALAQHQQIYPADQFERTSFTGTISPHGRASVIQWAIQGEDVDACVAQAAALRLSPPEAFTHMDAIDRAAAWNAELAPVPLQVFPGSYVIASGDSLELPFLCHAGAASHESFVSGSVRFGTDDATQPELVVPLSLHITGGQVVGVEPPASSPHPVTLALAGFRPNPGGASARIAYRLAGSEPATIALYDVRGRLVASHALEHPAPGEGSIALSTLGSVLPGVLWLRLEQAGQRVTRKAIVLP